MKNIEYGWLDTSCNTLRPLTKHYFDKLVRKGYKVHYATGIGRVYNFVKIEPRSNPA